MGIMKSGDLLNWVVFRGQTMIQSLHGGVDTSAEDWTYQGKKVALVNKDGTFSYRRSGRNPWNKDVYLWTPADAEKLRFQYFVSLYPFSLSDKRFNELFQFQLKELGETVVEPDQDVFGLLDASLMT